jgi:hypothetical protein
MARTKSHDRVALPHRRNGMIERRELRRLANLAHDASEATTAVALRALAHAAKQAKRARDAEAWLDDWVANRAHREMAASIAGRRPQTPDTPASPSN